MERICRCCGSKFEITGHREIVYCSKACSDIIKKKDLEVVKNIDDQRFRDLAEAIIEISCVDYAKADRAEKSNIENFFLFGLFNKIAPDMDGEVFVNALRRM